MKKILTLVIAMYYSQISSFAQCVANEIEYIDVYASDHCTSTSQKSTTVIFSPVRRYEYSGVFHWMMRKNPSSSWTNLDASWEYVVSTGQIVNTRVGSSDAMKEFMLVFTEDSTGCTDSCTERLVLDISPLVTVSEDFLGGKRFFTAINGSHDASLSDEVTWFDSYGRTCGMGDTLFATISPCFARIIDCNGCVGSTKIKSCTTSDMYVYPNPANDVIYLETRNACDVLLCDVSGKSVTQGYIDDSLSMTLTTSMLSSGLYILRVCDEVSIILIQH